MKITVTITRKTLRHVFFKMHINYELVSENKVRNEDFEKYCEIIRPYRLYDTKPLSKIKI